jgi:hypothetical protein
MRHNAKRPSNRNRGPQGNNNNKKNGRMKVYDSNGPDTRIRGTAFQVTEKYEILAKDAERSGNIMLAENYRQHAEHYQRIINSFEDEAPKSNDKKPVEKKAEPKQEQPVEDLGLPASMIAEAPVDAEPATV